MLNWIVETEQFDYLAVCKQEADTIYLTPPLGQDMTQGQFLSGV